MKLQKYGLVGVCILFFFFIATQVEAQRTNETFGRNRIQYKDFSWSYLNSENFDLYYYGDRKKLAGEALQYLEAEFVRITDLLGYYPYQKTKIFLYNSITDLQQSNVGLYNNRYNVSGETVFIKPYVEIAHPGNLDEFKQELVYKMSTLLVNEMMFGGSLRDMFASGVLLNTPTWFIDGISNYVAYGWNDEMDDYVRQLVVSKKLNKALHLPDKEAALVGQSIWNYIVERYGKSSVNNILNYTRIIRNEEKSVLYTIGIPFKQLISNWKEFYKAQEQKVSQSYVSLDDSVQLTKQKRNQVTYTTVKISPDGKNIAYAINDRGKFSVKVRSLETGKETTILNGGNTVVKQTVDYRVPLLNWADATTLGVMGVKKGQYIFWLYDLKSKKKLPRELDKFSNIRSFSFSNNGRLVIVSADFEGQNDLFLLSSRRDRTKRLTNDAFDDLDPSFIPNSNTIVFSSNRATDSLSTDEKALHRLSPNYNLFLFNIDTTTNRLKRITRTLSKDFHPRASDENNFYYMSDQRGITNLFHFDVKSGAYSQLTNLKSSIKDYDVNFEHSILSLVITQNLSENIFVEHNFDFTHNVFTAATRRKEVQQARLLIERKKKEPAKPTTIKDLINARMKEVKDTTTSKPQHPTEIRQDLPAGKAGVKKDTVIAPAKKTKEEISTDNYSFDDEPAKPKPAQPSAPAPNKIVNTDNYTFDEAPSQPQQKPVQQNPPTAPKTLSTDNYVFEEDATKQKPPANQTFLTRYNKAREMDKVQGPFPYLPKMGYDNFVTALAINPLRGFEGFFLHGLSLQLQTHMSDMLENYRFNLGLQVATDLKTGNVYGEFLYLPHRVDFSARIDRQVVYWNTQNTEYSSTQEEQKYSYQKLELGASYPISVRTRVSIKPFTGFTQFVDRGATSPISSGGPTFYPSQSQFYTGARVELVYDNSVVTGLNIIEGTRGKLSGITYMANGNSKLNFSQVYADVRHYQKIYKEIVLAVRGYAGTFFGNAPKKYMLGGVDNWLGCSVNYSGTQNPLVNSYNAYNQNIMFSEFISLRGFDYATQYGNSVATASAELRVPLIRALASGPISSSFFKNLQFTGFYDIGSSWSGAIPFGNQTDGPVQEIRSGPFIAKINQYLNPWIYSYGFGLRSMIFGYYIKCDFAWPVVNYQVQSPRAQLSLGFDF